MYYTRWSLKIWYFKIPYVFFNKPWIDSDLESNIENGEELHNIYKIVEDVMAREKGLYPNTDYPIALLFYMLGIPIPLYTPISK